MWNYVIDMSTSVAMKGGGGGGNYSPHVFFSGSFGNVLVHVSRQACHLYRQKYPKYEQNIERNSSFRMWKYQHFLSSIARIYIDFLGIAVCRYIVVYSTNDK